LATVEGSGVGTATTTYLHPDHLGGTNVATDENGEVVQTLDYYPYGSQRIASGSFDEQRRFIGEEFDGDTEFSYLNARYYQGSRGQFLSHDPLFLNLGANSKALAILADPQLLNAYSYSRNNPLTLVDDGGEIPHVIVAGAVIGGIGGAVSQYISDVNANYQSGASGLNVLAVRSSPSEYAASALQGVAVGAAAAFSPFSGGAAATISSGARDYFFNDGQVDVVNALAQGAVTTATAGFLKGLPQVRGIQPYRLDRSAYYIGSHTQRYAAQEAFGLGTGLYFSNVQGLTNSYLSPSNRSVSSGTQSPLTASESGALKGLAGAFAPGASSRPRSKRLSTSYPLSQAGDNRPSL
jgi:RHS repeat-associated protein